MAEAFDGIVTVSAAPGGNPVITLNGGTGQCVLGGSSQDGDFVLRDSAGQDRFIFDGQNGTLTVRDSNGQRVVVLDSRFSLLDLGASGNEGDLRIRNNAGTFVFRFDANFAVLDIGGQGSEGDIRLYDNAGAVSIHLDGGTGDIRLIGADCAEEFDVEETLTSDPGSVMSIGDVGQLRLCAQAYDTRVAGVVSGAGSYSSGIVMDSRDGPGPRTKVALSGKVYCKIDAGYGAVRAGDLLTTSATAGHAMKAADPALATGAVLGKALQPLEHGIGMIPILVTLQ